MSVCVCVCVCVCVTEVGCSSGGTRLVTRDLRTSQPRTLRRMFENIGHGLERLGLQADAIGEQ